MATNDSRKYVPCTVRKIDSLWELQPGDHIRTRGELGEFIDTYSADLKLYTHHMLVVRVVSNSKILIIHKTPRGVEETTVSYQAKDIEVLDYECSYTGDKAIQRARERMKQNYNLWVGNCEHFVTEVKTGEKQSIQVRTAVKVGFVAAVVVCVTALATATLAYMFGGKSSKERDSDDDSDDDMFSQKKGSSTSYKPYY